MGTPFSPTTCRGKLHIDAYYKECDEGVPSTFIPAYVLQKHIINETNRNLYLVTFQEFPGADTKAYLLVESIYTNEYMVQLSSKLCLCQKASAVKIAPKIIDHYYCTGYLFNTAVITYEYFDIVGLEEYIKEYISFFDNFNYPKLDSVLSSAHRKKALEIFAIFLSIYRAQLYSIFFLKATSDWPSSLFLVNKTKEGDFHSVFLNILYSNSITPTEPSTYVVQIIKEIEKIKNMVTLLFPFPKTSFLDEVKNTLLECMDQEKHRLIDHKLAIQYSQLYKSNVKKTIIQFIEEEIKKATIQWIHFLSPKYIKLTAEDILLHFDRFSVKNTDVQTTSISQNTDQISKYPVYSFPNCGSLYTASTLRNTGVTQEDVRKYREQKLFYYLNQNYKTILPDPKKLKGDTSDIYIEKKIVDLDERKKYIVFFMKNKQKQTFLLEEVNYQRKTIEEATNYVRQLILLGYYKICPDIYENYICKQLISSKISRITLSPFRSSSIPLPIFLAELFKGTDMGNNIVSILSFFHCFILQYLFMICALGMEYKDSYKLVKNSHANVFTDSEKSDFPYFYFRVGDTPQGSPKNAYAIEYPTTHIHRIDHSNAGYDGGSPRVQDRITKCIKNIIVIMDEVFTPNYISIEHIRMNQYLFQIAKKYMNNLLVWNEQRITQNVPVRTYIANLSGYVRNFFNDMVAKLFALNKNDLGNLQLALNKMNAKINLIIQNKILNVYDSSISWN